MPFTLAHPAAIVPISKLAGKRTSLSALVIGSMMPDAVYFLPLGIDGRTSHSLPALFWFCLPAGLLAYILFHSFIKRPAAALLPLELAARLPSRALQGPWKGPASTGTVIFSLFLGALTHIVWDAFTHAHSSIVIGIDMLRFAVASVGAYPIPLYKVLQHVSSLVGLAALALWIRAWCVHSRPSTDLPPELNPCLPAQTRLIIIAAIIASGVVFALARAANASHRTVEDLLVRVAVGGMVGAGIAGAAFCVGWQIVVARRKRYA